MKEFNEKIYNIERGVSAQEKEYIQKVLPEAANEYFLWYISTYGTKKVPSLKAVILKDITLENFSEHDIVTAKVINSNKIQELVQKYTTSVVEGGQVGKIRPEAMEFFTEKLVAEISLGYPKVSH